MSAEQLALYVQKLRRQRSWTQAHLAEASNLSLRTVQRLERGDSCSRETLLAVAGAFNISVEDLTARLYRSPATAISPSTSKLRRLIMFGKESAQRLFSWTGLFYLAGVLAIAVYGNYRFPGFVGHPFPSLENDISAYRQFLAISGILSAIYLGIWSGLLSGWQAPFWRGFLFLGAGVFATLLIFSTLPWIKYPNDQYPVPALWVMYCLLPTVGIWLLTGIAGRFSKDRLSTAGTD